MNTKTNMDKVKFGRVCKLYLRNSTTNALDLSDLHVTFEIHQAITNVPNWALIRIYNLSVDTLNRAEGEFDHVDLYAGYGKEAARLFYGQIAQYNGGLRDSAKDHFLEIVAQDGDFAANWTTINHTLKAGWTQADQAQLATDAMKDNGVPTGYVGDLPQTPLPRGKAIFGMARDTLHQVQTNANADWSIQDGEVQILPYEQTLPNQMIVLTSATGLIGTPQRTVDGVMIKALIDPRFKRGALVQIDNSFVQDPNVSVASGADNYYPSLDRNGIYKIYAADHEGDTRGRAWYSTLTCVAAHAGAGLPLSTTFQNAIPNPRSRSGNG
jgi:hypothetical protein